MVAFDQPKTYKVNEMFYSLQGEGMRAGTANVFVRFSDCNLACRKDGVMGFDCDTEFVSGRQLTGEEIVAACEELGGGCRNVIFTGGEPALQLDEKLVNLFHGWYKCVETNGTLDLPGGLDWVCVSPKTAEHTLKVKRANEVKYVRRFEQEIPQPSVNADFQFVSPAFEDALFLPKKNLEWCISLVRAHPVWRLSIQQHKLWGVR